MTFISSPTQIVHAILSEPVIQNSSSTLVINVSAAPEVPSPEEPVTQSIPHAAQPATKAHHHATDRVSNLELENKLLRQEVTSLNEELVSVVQRAKESEKGGYMYMSFTCGTSSDLPLPLLLLMVII